MTGVGLHFLLSNERAEGVELQGEYPLNRTFVPPWACPTCHRPFQGVKTEPVRLARTPIGVLPLSGGSFAVHTLFARRGFLEEVCGGDVDQFFCWAIVLEPDGSPHEDWLVVVGRYRLEVRGNDQPSYDYCKKCSSLIYMAFDETFIYPPPNPDVDVFDAGPYAIVITERVIKRLSAESLSGLTVRELVVPDEALDGFGELPNRLPDSRP